MTTIDDITQAQNAASAALQAAYDAIGQEIARTSERGQYLTSLITRHQALQDQLDEIDTAALTAVLNLPNVAAAVAQLNSLSGQMKQRAAELPGATSVLTKATDILSLGQQFTALLGSAQKPSS